MIRNFGGTEIIVILLVVVLLFGSRRIPELARSLGRSMSEFKKGRREGAESESSTDQAPSDKV